jgi:5'-nucleotidase
MKILISNDDGVKSEGLIFLADELKKIGKIYVVAPDRERSAVSHSLTLHRPLRIEEIDKDFYSVDGTPTDCIILGIFTILKEKPDLVVTGINKGGNLGEDITYSGTVSAAVEATLLNIPAFAISLVARENFIFETASRFALRLSNLILDKGLPKDTFLNVNVPNINYEDIKGVLITRQGRRVYNEAVFEYVDPRGKKYYWIGDNGAKFENIDNTDYKAVSEKYVSVTPLCIDITNYSLIEGLKTWRI